MRSFSFKVKTENFRSAVRVGISVGLPLLAVYMSDHIHFAVYAAFGGLTSLYGHSESVQRRVETQAVVGAALVVTLAAAAFYSAAHGPEWLLSLMLAVVVVAAGTIGTVMGWVPRGEIFFILVLLVVAGIPLTVEEVLVAIAIGAGAAGFSVLLTMLVGNRAVDTRALASGVRSRTLTGSAALDWKRHVIVITIAALAVTGAWMFALAVNIGHPFWAPIAVSALMPAINPADAIRRAIHMMLGTLGGVAIAAVLFAPGPGPLALIIIIALCQAVAELYIARNYALALLFITPLAVGMSNLGRGLPWSPLLIERLVEAGIGAAIAFVAIVIASAILARLDRLPADSKA